MLRGFARSIPPASLELFIGGVDAVRRELIQSDFPEYLQPTQMQEFGNFGNRMRSPGVEKACIGAAGGFDGVSLVTADSHEPPHDLPIVDWARRVNRTWIVRGGLDGDAEAWLEHLAELGDGRLERSCEAAKAMCDIRDRSEDPKPWFYAGLFSLATAEEARRFLAGHRITQAALPAMADDEGLRAWLDGVGAETRELVTRLRRLDR